MKAFILHVILAISFACCVIRGILRGIVSRLHAALFAGNRIDKVKMHSKLTSLLSYVVSEEWSFSRFVG